MMQLKLSILILAFFLLGIPDHDVKKPKGEAMSFEGTVLGLAPEPRWVSGITAVYRLVKYRVERVCEGRYQGTEIVVDHLILTGKELQGVKVGDRVCVSVVKSNKIFERYNEKGIREPSDEVKIFYIGDKASPAKQPPCDC